MSCITKKIRKAQESIWYIVQKLDFFFVPVCPTQGRSHYNGRWATELKCIQAFIPGTETLALLKSP